MHHFRHYSCALLCLVSIAGCVSSSPYPDDWPKLEAATDLGCSDLTGSYENYGQWDDGDPIKLAGIFFSRQDPNETLDQREVLAVSHVTFDDRGKDGVVVEAWVGEELLMERQLTASQLPCREGRLVYDDPSWSVGGAAPILPVVGHSSVDRLITLATDGSLVMENKEFSVGAALVIPLAVKARTWFMFPATAPDSPGMKTDINSPQGVRSGAAPHYSLRPPDGARTSSGYDDAKACLDRVKASKDAAPDPQTPAMLGGRSTQAFIIQAGRDGPLVPEGRIVGWDTWIPVTHELRIEKLHWQPPSFTDRYVICMLRKGYRWNQSIRP